MQLGFEIGPFQRNARKEFHTEKPLEIAMQMF